MANFNAYETIYGGEPDGDPTPGPCHCHYCNTMGAEPNADPRDCKYGER